jgi:hypothetical protein
MTRKIFIDDELDAELVDYLASIGYDVIDVRTMSKNSDAEKRDYLVGTLEGMSSGTIGYSDDRRKALELEAKILGLMVSKSMKLDIKANIAEKNIDELLDMAGGKKLLLRKSTPERIKLAEKASIDPSVKFGGENGT